MGQRQKFNSDVGPTKSWSTCRGGLARVLSVRVILSGAGITACPLQSSHSSRVDCLGKVTPPSRLLSTDHSPSMGQSFLDVDLGGSLLCLSHLD